MNRYGKNLYPYSGKHNGEGNWIATTGRLDLIKRIRGRKQQRPAQYMLIRPIHVNGENKRKINGFGQFDWMF